VFVSCLHALPSKPKTPALYSTSYPCGIALSSAGELVVAGSKGEVVILNKNGTKVKSFIKDLGCFAVDDKDYIYFVDNCSNQIGKSNLKFDPLNEYEVDQIYGLGHIYIAVYGDEVMVTEYNNVGQIMVHDKNLDYKRCIFGRGSSTVLSYFSLDTQGNIYVIDSNKSIQIINNQGVFIGIFLCNEADSPWMVKVFNQHVYVSDLPNCLYYHLYYGWESCGYH